MKKLTLLIAVFTLFAVNTFAQYSKEKAEENPIDCALYLLSKDKDALRISFFPQELIKIGRYDDALFLIGLDKGLQSKVELYTQIGKEFLDKNNFQEADRFLTKAVTVLRDEEEWSERGIKTLASSLVRANRSAEAFEILAHQEEDSDKADILISLAETYSQLGQKEMAGKLLDEAFTLRASFASDWNVSLIISLLIQDNSREKAAEYLTQFEADLSQIGDVEERNRQFVNLLPLLYYKIGQKEKAFDILNRYGDKDDSKESLHFVQMLLKNNDKENTASFFKKIKLNQDRSSYYGGTLVEIYLKLDDVKSAMKTVNEMSADVDDYHQQSAFMLIADKLIAEKKTSEALNLLEFAYLRAAKVGETHEANQSRGASPLTRKIDYLANIGQRYFKLNRFDQGLAVANALKVRDDFYQEFYSALLIDYVKEKVKTLPRKKIDIFLEKAEKVFDEDEDYKRMRARVSIAEIYAKLGEKLKAVDLLTKVLQEAKESCCYDDDFLLAAGKVFDEYKLTADENMRTILRQYIED